MEGLHHQPSSPRRAARPAAPPPFIQSTLVRAPISLARASLSLPMTPAVLGHIPPLTKPPPTHVALVRLVVPVDRSHVLGTAAPVAKRLSADLALERALEKVHRLVVLLHVVPPLEGHVAGRAHVRAAGGGRGGRRRGRQNNRLVAVQRGGGRQLRQRTSGHGRGGAGGDGGDGRGGAGGGGGDCRGGAAGGSGVGGDRRDGLGGGARQRQPARWPWARHCARPHRCRRVRDRP